MVLSLLYDWATTLSLVFGGCCSNAITLEQLTSEYPKAGSLITFFQFIIISLYGLPRHITWTRYGPRFKPHRIPLTPYLIQVALFYLISLLNNAAFGYRIPMAVHIIFRSGGLIISMVLGWLVGKTYTVTQVLSVILVTFGVILTTLSASQTSTSANSSVDSYTYGTGIAILTLALLLSGFLGLVQDRTYAQYGRPDPPGTKNKTESGSSPAWQESMFYLHFLSLPMFLFLRHDLSVQFATVNAGTPTSLTLPNFAGIFPLPRNTTVTSQGLRIIHIPAAYLPLLINTLAQLLCVAGVHRLTTRVSALTVTLVLVVRKAVSLVLSVVGIGMMGRSQTTEVDKFMMWTGAGMVLLGTVGYTIGTGGPPTKNNGDKPKKE
ncbi:UAA transporter [Collybia nuda]|uniref:UAA transporter n=1 Tax=Collybia nuda TaxID=64659 RepID=A0A9P5YAS3_9AGAR|nr:UAA transporter [Collybia nuda]